MMAPALVIFALVSGVPYIDIRKTCRAAQATGVAIDQKAAYNGCVADETEAKQTLIRTWARLSRAYRASCVEESTGMSPSYVELLTCLEMRDGGKFTGGVAPNAVPPPAVRGGAGSAVDPNAVPGTGTGSPALPGTGLPGSPAVPGTGLPASPGAGSSSLPDASLPGSPGVPGVPGLPPPASPPGMTGSPATGSK